MKYLISLTVLLIVLLPATLLAQMSGTAEVKQITEKYDMGVSKAPSIPFFDLSRLNISHSYSIGFFSGGGSSGSQALYSGTFQYQLASPLMLTLNLGILHDPGTLFGSNNPLGNKAQFYPSGQLDWRPSDNFHMSIGFQSYPATYYSPLGNGRNPFWRY
ncbi:MAG: hypothetical protein KAR42_14610 [candidate division Zixibacteria bacterium]|nr:hypothetical protein [candidate division Zixibacteria bacterium]